MSMGLMTLGLPGAYAAGEKVKDAILALVISGVSVGIGFASYAGISCPCRNIPKETMRGGRTELTNHTNKTESKDGLSKDYAFGYSYGLGETFTVLVATYVRRRQRCQSGGGSFLYGR